MTEPGRRQERKHTSIMTSTTARLPQPHPQSNTQPNRRRHGNDQSNNQRKRRPSHPIYPLFPRPFCCCWRRLHMLRELLKPGGRHRCDMERLVPDPVDVDVLMGCVVCCKGLWSVVFWQRALLWRDCGRDGLLHPRLVERRGMMRLESHAACSCLLAVCGVGVAVGVHRRGS